ncbi:MAG: site-specific integrase [Candidatus Sulfotelmatobacter sp.]|jgi:site-specific recombinase XerD
MANTSVSIRERIKRADGRWGWSTKISIPEGKFKPADAERSGKFYLVWTEHGKKREAKIRAKTLEAAVKAARAKQRHLEDNADGFKRADPLLQPNERKTIADSIDRYLKRVEISQDAQTLKAYRRSLRQFESWTAFIHMDEIDHDHVMAFRKHAESKGNSRLTADWKAMRVNKFVKVTLGLADGKGPIRKSDLGKMKPNGAPKIYTRLQIEAFFEACRPHEELRYRTLYEPAFRKKELIYLEKEDVLVGQQMLRVQSKVRYDENGKLLYTFKAKANSERNVPITKELMQQIVEHMNNPVQQNSRLVFFTRTGLPDTHPWDKLQAIAKRVGIGKFDLKRFRATRATEWLRPKWLGGYGYDIPTVRDLLGHDQDSESIWAYVRAVEMETLVAEDGKGHRGPKPPGFDAYWNQKHPNKCVQQQPKPKQMDNSVPDYSCRPGEMFDCVPEPGSRPWAPWLPLYPQIPELPQVGVPVRVWFPNPVAVPI